MLTKQFVSALNCKFKNIAHKPVTFYSSIKYPTVMASWDNIGNKIILV